MLLYLDIAVSSMKWTGRESAVFDGRHVFSVTGSDILQNESPLMFVQNL